MSCLLRPPAPIHDPHLFATHAVQVELKMDIATKTEALAAAEADLQKLREELHAKDVSQTSLTVHLATPKKQLLSAWCCL
jgi:hypothetical protein